jgi:hypothetical protein
MGKPFFPLKKGLFEERYGRNMQGHGRHYACTNEEEVMRAIRALPFVTKLSPVGARNSHGHGYRVSLRCPSCEEYAPGSCGKKQEPPV